MLTSTATPPLNLLGATEVSSSVNLFGIQGEAGTGKSFAALSFPKPVVMDYDKKVPPKEVVGIPFLITVPFYSDNFIHEIMGTKPPLQANRKLATIKWLRKEAVKLTADYTLVLDSYTIGIDNMHNLFVLNNQALFVNRDGAYDGYKAFNDKLLFNIELFAVLKSLDCTVVVIFHEQIARNEKGQPTGKYRPLCTGQFKDQICGHFGTLLRQTKTNEGEHWWSVKSDSYFNAMVSPCYQIPADVKRIRSSYDSLQQYRISHLVSGETQQTNKP